MIFRTAIFYLLLWSACRPDLPAEISEVKADLPRIIDYNLHIRPILSDRCYQCHGPDKNSRKASLRLDTREGLFMKRDSSGPRPPVMPGKPWKSEVVHRITSMEADRQMPPPESKLSLSALEKATLIRWIEQGAEWKPHWSFIPPEKASLPDVEQKGWPLNEIDHFILNKLEREGLQPRPEADKETLLRRVSFDLTGLPPSIEEMDAFLADKSAGAYEEVVNRLLGSSHYGEHMAVSWLDLARYADTHGYQADYYRPHWQWRDWVIKAFNENMPYDRFVTWQLAGDLLPRAGKEQVLATGFNRNHAQNAEGGIVQEEFRVEYVADRTQTFSTAFLGLTMECSRCHDHKYDPISQKEFYQLYSFFNNVAEAGQITWYQSDLPGPTLLLPEAEVERQINFIDSLSSRKESEIAQLKRTRKKDFRYWLESGGGSNWRGIPARGLIAHYPLQGIRPERIENRVSKRNPGRIINPTTGQVVEETPDIVTGVVQQGLRLNGDEALSFPGVGQFARWQPFSIALWVYVPQTLQDGVIFHSNKGSALYTFKGYQLSVEQNYLDVRIAHDFPYNAIHLLSADPVPKGRWIHLTLAYDGSSRASGATLFLNGEPLPMKVKRDKLFKDILFYDPDTPGKITIDTHLKIGARWRGKGFTGGRVDELRVYQKQLTTLEVAALAGNGQWNTLQQKTAGELSEMEESRLFEYYLNCCDASYQEQLRTLDGLRKQKNELVEPVDQVMVMDEMSEPRPAAVLVRGAYDAPAEAVQPGTPARVLPFPEPLETNRLGLAKWLFLSDNPLPARVAVNRYWQHFFGTGIVETTEDFGSQGKLPTHPQLLDWLAREFMDSGWDIKALQKKIVLSATYRQSSQADSVLLKRDPDNRLLARGPRFRLSAEMLRDQALAASGLLVRRIGGPSVKPYQPEGLWDFNRMSGEYEQDHGEKLYRRSLYTFWKRTIPPPAMNTFDAPSRAHCVVKRQKTATPLQALVLMNDPQFVEASRILAERVLKTGGDGVEKKIGFAYRSLTGTHPAEPVIKLLSGQYRQGFEEMSRHPEKAANLLTVGEYPADETLPPPQVAAWTTIVMTIMNLDASITKK